MIIVRLLGGLGNQLFQYACGRALALKHNVPLLLDLEHYEGNDKRFYRLDAFNINASIARPVDIMKFALIHKDPWRDRYRNWLFQYFPSMKRTWILQENLDFDLRVPEAGEFTYLDGFWQSEKYFLNQRDMISRELTIKRTPATTSFHAHEKIKSTQSIGVHVRRGDYVQNPETNRVHGVCSIDYYRKAASFLKREMASPYFFVFSDDACWAKENLSFLEPVMFVDGENEIEDFRLLSLCQHFIIANSSFSWWAAWLSNNVSKKVIAPDKWFADDSYSSEHIYPGNWIRI